MMPLCLPRLLPDFGAEVGKTAPQGPLPGAGLPKQSAAREHNNARAGALPGGEGDPWPAITMPRHSVAPRMLACLGITIISAGIWRFQ
jgi:hypothetical protein